MNKQKTNNVDHRLRKEPGGSEKNRLCESSTELSYSSS